MKRMILTGLAVALVAALASVSIVAQQPQGRGRGAGMGMGMGPGGGPGGPGGPFPLLRELNLTAEQREQIRTIMEEQRSGNPPQEKIGDLERQLQIAILDGDQQKIAEIKTALIAAHNEALADRIALQTKIAQILTAEQKAKEKELLANAPAGPRGRGPGRGGFGMGHFLGWLR
jgi:Spy/CpxP family protein refolding chaperone